MLAARLEAVPFHGRVSRKDGEKWGTRRGVGGGQDFPYPTHYRRNRDSSTARALRFAQGLLRSE